MFRSRRCTTAEPAPFDPCGFFAPFSVVAAPDEIRCAPELLRYLREEFDDRADPRRFAFTDSQHPGLSATDVYGCESEDRSPERHPGHELGGRVPERATADRETARWVTNPGSV